MPSLTHPQRAVRGWGALLLVLILWATARLGLAQAASLPARSAPLLLPSAIAYDTQGNLYLAETQANAVRRVDLSGNIVVIAGTGTQGFGGDGGPATGAELNSPEGVAVDSAGNIYVADSSNNRIRRIDAATAVVTTIAGNGKAGFGGDGAAAVSALLDLPRAIALDVKGEQLYIADSRNHRIRKVDLMSGTISTVAGDGRQGFSGDGGAASAASLDSPESIAVDLSGNLFLADTHNRRIRRVAAGTGTISTVFGDGTTGVAAVGTTALGSALALPRGLTVDRAGNLYVVDSGNHRVVRVDATTGVVTVAAGDGTEGFGGDGGAAVLAGLDSPRAAAIAPSGLLTMSDSGNQRVRQLAADPAPLTAIRTIAGLGAAVPGVLSISAPTVVAYGSGSVTASLNAGGAATGQVTFLEVGNGSSTVLGTGTLAANAAMVSLSGLAAGQHHIVATYAGDGTHAAAESSTAPVTVSPLALTATPATPAMVYGAAVPALSGSLIGVLAQDAGRVVAAFSTAATSTTPAGTYPIAVTLTGVAAGNYVLQPVSAKFVIAQANSSVSLANTTNGSGSLALAAKVMSATSGVPTGAVNLLDNGALVQQGTLTAGVIAFSPLSLSAGTHVLSATYGGDPNFLPSASASMTETISAAPAANFAIANTGAGSQLLVGGGSVSYNLSVSTSGSLSSPIALAVSGLPSFTTVSFSPSYVPPGGSGSTAVVMTVMSGTTAASAGREGRPGSGFVLGCALPWVLVMFGRGKARRPKLATAAAIFAVSAGVWGCGDRVNSTTQPGTKMQSYTLTITGTTTQSDGTTLQHSTDVVLQMSSGS